MNLCEPTLDQIILDSLIIIVQTLPLFLEQFYRFFFAYHSLPAIKIQDLRTIDICILKYFFFHQGLIYVE